MTENLRLNKRDKSKVRLSIAVLIAIILASMAAGYVLAQKTSVTGNAVVDKNCIPLSDLNYFINQSNIFQNAYYKCEEDLWALNFAYKQATVKEIKPQEIK